VSIGHRSTLTAFHSRTVSVTDVAGQFVLRDAASIAAP
jgi:ABC-type uncharacterized transport system fused permease/ATPase subunit